MLSTTQHKSSSSPIAVIDIGTNTLRLLIGCVSGGSIVRIASERVVTRLGENLLKTGNLNSNNADISISTLCHFKAICESYKVGRIIAVGTSALRDARDSHEFQRSIKQKTDLDVIVISGEEEADFTLKGIHYKSDLFNMDCSVLVDVGGGSTELIICNKSCTKSSFPVGAVKLLELFIKNDPPTYSELNEIKRYLIGEFEPVLSSIPPRAYSLIATGGTSATLASMHLKLPVYDGDKVQGQLLTYAEIVSMFERLTSVTLKERYNIIGLEPRRSDIIITGTMIIITIMEVLNVKELIVSDYGLMEGVLLEAANCE